MSANINLQTKEEDNEKKMEKTGLVANLIYGKLTYPLNETLWGLWYS